MSTDSTTPRQSWAGFWRLNPPSLAAGWALPCGRPGGSCVPACAGCPGPAGSQPARRPTRGRSPPGPGWLRPASATVLSEATGAGHRSAAGPPAGWAMRKEKVTGWSPGQGSLHPPGLPQLDTWQLWDERGAPENQGAREPPGSELQFMSSSSSHGPCREICSSIERVRKPRLRNGQRLMEETVGRAGIKPGWF